MKVRKKNIKIHNKAVVYQAKSGAILLKSDIEHETFWANQADIANLYEKDQSVISRHINSIFKDGEVDEKSNMQKMHIANSDKPVVFYSLDIILAVGYRTNSKKAIEFRKWATKTLKQYIVDGYAINRKRIAVNYERFMDAVDDVKKLMTAGVTVSSSDILELISVFANTWISLDAYDKDALPQKGVTKKRVSLTSEKLCEGLFSLKEELERKGEATHIFGMEREKGSIAGIVGNVMQSFSGKDVYGTAEEKAAHLLYFMVKNHPFIDGNKRSVADSL